VPCTDSNCKTCSDANTCNECKDDFEQVTSGSQKTCKACEASTFFDPSKPVDQRCQTCKDAATGDPNCIECEASSTPGVSTCTKCDTDWQLKQINGVSKCEDCTVTGSFYDHATSKCGKCIDEDPKCVKCSKSVAGDFSCDQCEQNKEAEAGGQCKCSVDNCVDCDESTACKECAAEF
jgi:hypothetical protein